MSKLHEICPPDDLRAMRDALPQGGLGAIKRGAKCSYSFVQKILGGIEDQTMTDKVIKVIECAKKEIEKQISKDKDVKQKTAELSKTLSHEQQ